MSNKIVNGIVTFGRTKVIITSVVFYIIAIIVLIIGIVLLASKDKYTQKTIAKITNATCEKRVYYNKNSTRIKYSCNVDLVYNIDNKEYKNKLTFEDSRQYNINDNIEIKYNPEEPNEIIKSGISSKVAGGIMIGIGIFLIIVISLTIYFTMKSKYAAIYQAIH